MGDVVLVRHGQTEWSKSGRHTGRTDVPLDSTGEQQAQALRPLLARRTFGLVLSSPLQRAVRTAELAGLPMPGLDPDLCEWDYGSYDGRTTTEIRSERPGWAVWDAGPPDGESLAEVGARADRVIERVRQFQQTDDRAVALVGHGHALRVLGVRWIDLPPATARLFRLDTATVSVLSAEHDWPALESWNVSAEDLQA